jgi:uncharacterized protein (DUF488 family)
MTPKIFSIGHSTHSIDEFIGLLSRHAIALLADIRRFPGSRKFPHFNRDRLATTLPEAGIEYRWFEALGGRRGKAKTGSTTNLGLRNESFRNYADYMPTPEFVVAIDELLQAAGDKPTAIMCSEGLYWRCHRRLVSDYLLARGIVVEHILPSGKLQPHTMTEGGRITGGVPTYPSSDDAQQRLSF